MAAAEQIAAVKTSGGYSAIARTACRDASGGYHAAVHQEHTSRERYSYPAWSDRTGDETGVCSQMNEKEGHHQLPYFNLGRLQWLRPGHSRSHGIT